MPDLDEDVSHLPSIEGQPPSLDDLPSGCVFTTGRKAQIQYRQWAYFELLEAQR